MSVACRDISRAAARQYLWHLDGLATVLCVGPRGGAVKKLLASGAVALLSVAACSGGDASPATTLLTTEVSVGEPVVQTTADTGAPDTTAPTVATEVALSAGAASNTILPTVDGDRRYLLDAPGWDDLDPNDIGVFVPTWDQGKVDVGNGSDDASWVHDDLRATSLALRSGDSLVIMTTVDVYMIFAAESAEIEKRARALLPAELNDIAQIVISATHNHHGPESAFNINDDWYDVMANQVADTIYRAATSMEPARLEVVTGEHHFGQSDGRDPVIVDPRLNIMRVAADADDSRTIATGVQWASHPETTLGWDPPGDYSAECATKGWGADNCSADGRYFTADYPGIVRERVIAALGGEVLYFNGALGSQIGPGDADVWQIDGEHPVGDGVTAPTGAQPVAGAADLRGKNMARTQAIGDELAALVLELVAGAQPLEVGDIEWRQQAFYTALTNIGFRVLLADGDLGWQIPTAYNCAAKPFTDDNCTDDGGAFEDDPVLTPLVDSQIRKGDVLKSQITWVGLGDVGFLFMPGELSPELVIGLPADFDTNTAAYYTEPDLHAVGADYEIPGHLLDLVPTKTTFTVGLGGDELGYWIPINEARLKCLDLVFDPASGYNCQRLFDEGLLVTVDAVAGPVCRNVTDDPVTTSYAPEQLTALQAVCRYGQALGRELGEPDGHYEETNSAGWDLVDDLWAAALQLFNT